MKQTNKKTTKGVIEIAGGDFVFYPVNPREYLRTLLIYLCILVGMGSLIFMFIRRALHDNNDTVDGIYDSNKILIQEQSKTPLGILETDLSFSEKIDTIINDVNLAVYIPYNSTAELVIGVPDINDNEIIFAAQAADIRADNGKILGAFVLKGEPIAWGLSKKGYCAIINNSVTIGVSDNTPLFEEATECNGYFFRQYPLVDNEKIVENEPKNKTTRKALCQRGNQILIVVSESDESFHDFTQSLVDLGVENAIYIVGGHSSYGWYKDATGITTEFSDVDKHLNMKNESYIIWRAIH